MSEPMVYGRARRLDQDRFNTAVEQLGEKIVELLQERGTLETDDIRDRLCCASKQRLDTAVERLWRSGKIERRGVALRIRGDKRPWISNRGQPIERVMPRMQASVGARS